MRDTPLRSGALGRRQDAKGIFGGEPFVLGHAGMVEGIAHCCKQALSLIIARRIQLFMVPSGTVMRSASSS